MNTTRVAAVVNSPFHLLLLRANLDRLDYLFVMNDGLGDLAQACGVDFKATVKPLPVETPPDLSKPASIMSLRARNGLIYEQTEALLADAGIDRLIVFVEAKPMMKFLVDRATERGLEVELWEDGLDHYIQFNSGGLFWAKACLKLVAGYYPRRIFRSRIDRTRVLIRDRFSHRNLELPAIKQDAADVEHIDRILFLAQPLVEDNLVGAAAYRRAVVRIADELDSDVDYLCHPRESPKEFGHSRVHVRAFAGGAEQYCASRDYRAYVSAFSTASLNIGHFHKNYYIPALFGLRRAARSLERSRFVPVRVISSLSEIRRCSD